MNDLIRPTLYDAHHKVVPVTSNKKTDSNTWEIVGPICESGDWLAKNRELRLLEGDLICFSLRERTVAPWLQTITVGANQPK